MQRISPQSRQVNSSSASKQAPVRSQQPRQQYSPAGPPLTSPSQIKNFAGNSSFVPQEQELPPEPNTELLEISSLASVPEGCWVLFQGNDIVAVEESCDNLLDFVQEQFENKYIGTHDLEVLSVCQILRPRIGAHLRDGNRR